MRISTLYGNAKDLIAFRAAFLHEIGTGGADYSGTQLTLSLEGIVKIEQCKYQPSSLGGSLYHCFGG